MGKFFEDLLLCFNFFGFGGSGSQRVGFAKPDSARSDLVFAGSADTSMSNLVEEQAEVLAEQSFVLYSELDVRSQETVREYFRVTHEVNKLMMAVRLYGQCLKTDDLLECFERAERYYSGLGFLPVMPRSVDFACGESFDVVLARGLVQRRIPAKGLFFFASGVRRHLVRLDALYQKAAPRSGGPVGA